jgi:hypothetical protein
VAEKTNEVGATLSIGGVGVKAGVVPIVGAGVGDGDGEGDGVRHGVGMSRGDSSVDMDLLYPVAWVLGIKILVNPKKKRPQTNPRKKKPQQSRTRDRVRLLNNNASTNTVLFQQYKR